MKRPLAICAVSGGRADYGLLVSPLRAIRNDPDFALSVVLTGQHLMRDAGDTAARVRNDGFAVAADIDLGLAGDDAVSVTEAAGRGLMSMASVFAKLSPDLILLLGDRYEILCAAVAATMLRIPIAHIAGGDVTEGAFDDAFRHAITKMAHVHLVTNEPAARRVAQLGEAKEHIHVVGSPGLDLIRSTKPCERTEFFRTIGLEPKRYNILATFHPVTLAGDSLRQLGELLAALGMLGDDVALLFTGSNADPEGRAIEQQIRAFVAKHRSATFVASLGSDGYFSALAHMDAVVGNSSSGLYEAPSFGLPTVNVGDRQQGRLRAESVFNCAAEREAIYTALKAALARGRKPTANPYGDGHASERIVQVLKSVSDPRALLRKTFVDQIAA